VRTRLDVYRAQTLPVLEWYREHGMIVRTIDAIGSVEEVTRRAPRSDIDDAAAGGRDGTR
jgi:adenylate kinase